MKSGAPFEYEQYNFLVDLNPIHSRQLMVTTYKTIYLAIDHKSQQKRNIALKSLICNLFTAGIHKSAFQDFLCRIDCSGRGN